jgi:D-apiose dehydrogenase
MVNTCRESGVPYFIHENWRWQRSIRELKKVLASGAIGAPFRPRITCVSGFPAFSYEPWLKEWPEYILFDMGPRLLDTARFVFGEAEKLYCQTDRIPKDTKGEDVATVMLTMGGLTTLMVELGYAENYLEHETLCETPIFVEGAKGSAELGSDFWLPVTTKSGTMARRCPPPRYSWALADCQVCHASIVPCNANLLQALRGDCSAETPGDDNLKTLELVSAAYDSARSGKVVHFTPDRQVGSPGELKQHEVLR